MFYRVEMKGVFSRIFGTISVTLYFSGSTTTLSKSGSRNFTLLFVSRLGLVLVVLKRDDGGVRGGEGQQKKTVFQSERSGPACYWEQHYFLSYFQSHHNDLISELVACLELTHILNSYHV